MVILSFATLALAQVIELNVPYFYIKGSRQIKLQSHPYKLPESAPAQHCP